MFVPDETYEVFGGGGLLGLYDYGYILAKEERGVTDADLGARTHKVGTSIGSLAAAWMSLDVKTMEIIEFISRNERILQSLFTPNLRKLLLSSGNGNNLDDQGYCVDPDDLYLPKTHIGNEKALEAIVCEFMGHELLGDHPDLNIIVSDEEYRRPVVLSAKNAPDLPISQAVLASSSAKPLFPVRKIEFGGETHYCCDGGYTKNFGFDIAIDAGARYITGINFGQIGRQKIIENAISALVSVAFMHNEMYMEALFQREFNVGYEEFIGQGGVGRLRSQSGKKHDVMILNPLLDPELASSFSLERVYMLMQKGFAESKDAFDRYLALTNHHGLF